MARKGKKIKELWARKKVANMVEFRGSEVVVNVVAGEDQEQLGRAVRTLVEDGRRLEKEERKKRNVRNKEADEKAGSGGGEPGITH